MPHKSLSEVDRQRYKEYENLSAVMVEQPPYDIIQLKYDGIWCKLVVENEQGKWYSRTGELKKEASCLLRDGIYLGEFMYGSHWSTHPSRNGKTYLFDLIWDGSRDVRQLEYSRRYSFLVGRCPINPQAQIQTISSVHVSLAERFWERVLATRSEGLVFRRLGDNYGGICGRLKREVEVDYVVLDIIEGNNSLRGSLGALVCGLYREGQLVNVLKVGGGFKRPERFRIWSTWPEALHRVVQISGRGLFPSGALRHPNFVRFRDDKKPEECQFESLLSQIT